MIEKIVDYLKDTELTKKNYKGEAIITGGGLYFITGSIVVWFFYLIYNIGDRFTINQLIYLTLIIGAAGFIDDLAGGKKHQGFKGHFRSFFDGHVTTGLLKAVISATAVFLVIIVKEDNIIFMLSDLLLILLMTNLINLFDLRPGRALKFFLLLCIPLLKNGEYFLYLIPIFLLMIRYLSLEFKGKVMLGDTGSNTLGVILGLGYVNTFNFQLRVILLIGLLFFNIEAERVSFSKIIQNNPVLNWFDHLGRDD